MMPPVKNAVLATAAVLALILAGLPAAAGAAPLVGLQNGGILTATQGTGALDRNLAAMGALHAQVVRFEVSWAALEPRAQGQRDAAVVAEIDAFVDGATRRGIRPILYLDRTPCWASSAPESLRDRCAGAHPNRSQIWRYSPSDPASAVPVAEFLAARYGARLAAFQLWNEPDQANQKYWAGADKIGRYVALAKALYPAIKAASPGLPVLAGSFVGPDGRWLKALYQAGIKGSYDGLAVQFYDLPLYALRRTRRVQHAYGDAAPLWLTEFGYTSCAGRNGRPSHLADHPCVTAAVQRQNLGDVFSAIWTTPWIRAAVVYALRDETTAYQLGVLDHRGRRKPSYAAVRRAGSGRPGRLRTQTLRLRLRRGVVRATGGAPGIDIYTLRISSGGVLRYRAIIRPDRFNRFSVALPPVLGTRGLTATLTRAWDGRRVTARR
jgi:hypothetical protein